MTELQGALSARHPEVLCEHEVHEMVDLISRKMPRLQAVSRYIIRSWDSRFCCVVWKEHSSFSYIGQILDVGCPSIKYIQGSRTRHRGVPTANSKERGWGVVNLQYGYGIKGSS